MLLEFRRVLFRSVSTRGLGGAPGQQGLGIASGVDELHEALRRDQRDDGEREDHRPSSMRKAAEKPGPSALISRRSRQPRSFIRASTNSAVTADMLPDRKSVV